MELRHLRYFLTVAEELNFTRAAEKLCIAQPPLSRQIRDLEEELGTELFDRSVHPLGLTEAGLRFRPYAARVLELVEKSTEDIRELHQGLSGTLYLASVEGHAPNLVSDWIAGFHELHPNVQYNLWNGNSDDVIQRVNKGLCDLGVIMRPYNAERLNGVTVYREPWIALIPAEHPLAMEPGDTLSLKKLEPYELLVPSRQSRMQEINGWFEPFGIKPTVRCYLASLVNAYSLTERNLGITIYPASEGVFGENHRVCIKRLVEPEVEAAYELIWSKERPVQHLTRLFLEYVQQRCT